VTSNKRMQLTKPCCDLDRSRSFAADPRCSTDVGECRN
jgi:hypothetical protein